MTSSRALRAEVRLLAAALIIAPLAIGPSPAPAQLRPLDPFDWRSLAPDTRYLAGIGGGGFVAQRASLAGEEGRLLELGSYLLVWRTGRVALEASGTAVRTLRRDHTFAPPSGGAEASEGRMRRDAGDQRIATTVRLTPAAAPLLAVLRFGTRLPTTDNRVGLERDQTDFFALLGGRVTRGALGAALETGVSLNGTREPHYEQSDVLVFIGAAEYALRGAALKLALTGHADGLSGRAVRGSEELAELRVGARFGDRQWVQLQLVRGLTDFSPRLGLLILGGIRR